MSTTFSIATLLSGIDNVVQQADVAEVIGANDIANPAAKTDPQSPIFGMRVLDVDAKKTSEEIVKSLE